MKISENRHRMVEVKRSHDCAMLVEDSESVVLLRIEEIPSAIRELKRIYDEIMEGEGMKNSIMHDPPIPF